MALVVEDGTGKSNAESYVSVSDCATYASARGLSFASSPVDLAEQALRRATAFIDGAYGSSFSGERLKHRDQALEWPRAGAVDATGYPVAPDSVPIEVKNATCEAAVRELAVPNSLTPDLKRGGMIESVKAGSVAVTYSGAAPASTTFQKIDQIMAALIGKTASFSAITSRA